MLRGIRVDSNGELEERMLGYIDELNNDPAVFTWKYMMDEMSGGIKVI